MKGNATTAEEQEAVAKFINHAQSTLEGNLLQVWLFGSTARGDRWAVEQQMRADIDVLVITRHDASKDDQQLLVDATYPLFLMCGSTISPQFRSLEWVNSPPNATAKDFVVRLEADALGPFPETARNQRFRPGQLVGS